MLLYADDLVLVAGAEELLMEKLRKWRMRKGRGMKGLRVNTGKTKVMRCQVSSIGVRGQHFLVAFADRGLVAILYLVCNCKSVTVGFIKGVVASQVDQGIMLISIEGDVWSVVLIKLLC